MKKINIMMSIIILTIFMISTGCIDEKPIGDTKTINVDTNYNSKTSGWNYNHFNNIQDAINALDENGTIYVKNGIYYENLIINKSINLIGENSSTTIIDANGIDDAIYISKKGKLNINNFAIQNSGNSSSPNNDAGIDIRSNNNNIVDNLIYDNYYGIYSTQTQNNNFSKNTILSNSNYGIHLYTGSNSNIIYKNVFLSNRIALRIKGSKFNEVVKNLFEDNEKGVYLCCGSRDNIIYVNIFNNNIQHGDDTIGNNYWDNSIIGNYWDDYNGIDDNADGIGDTPYNVDTKGIDNYPIIKI